MSRFDRRRCAGPDAARRCNQGADVDSGCIHGAGWLVRTLAGQLAGRLATELGGPLPDLVAEAIKATCDTHADTCDLSNPDSPSATVVMLREHPGMLDWLPRSRDPHRAHPRRRTRRNRPILRGRESERRRCGRRSDWHRHLLACQVVKC
jgi:hypothetical protein